MALEKVVYLYSLQFSWYKMYLNGRCQNPISCVWGHFREGRSDRKYALCYISVCAQMCCMRWQIRHSPCDLAEKLVFVRKKSEKIGKKESKKSPLKFASSLVETNYLCQNVKKSRLFVPKRGREKCAKTGRGRVPTVPDPSPSVRL